MSGKLKDIKSKLKKILAGTAIVAASFGAAKTANAQEDEYGVRNMTEQEKTERLAEIKVEIDSVDRVIATKQENYDLVKDFIMEKFPFEEYKDRGWNIAVGGYIRDDIIKNIDEEIKTTKDSAQISKLEKEKSTVITFFNYEKQLADYEVVSISVMANWLAEKISRNVNDDKLTPEEGKIIAEKLNPYLEIKRIPTASKYDVLYSELNRQWYLDVGGVRTGYMNGEISPKEYSEQTERYKKIYDLLFRLLKAVEKDGDLRSANSQYYAFMALKTKAERSLRYSQRQKTYLLDEQNAILMPPVIQKDAVKKAKSRGGR